MARIDIRIALLAVILLFASVSAFALLNPHIKPEPCDSCHAKVPTKEDGEKEDFFLLKDDIDALCHVCHEKKCCKPGDLGHLGHPSGIEKWDTKKFRRPKTLPLYEGKITCTTCHFHSRQDGTDYKMVRIVKIDGKKIDWTDLCHDCHIGY